MAASQTYSAPVNKLRAALAARTARRQLTWTQGVQVALDELIQTLRQHENMTSREPPEEPCDLVRAMLDNALHLSNRVRTAVILFRSGAITAAKMAKLEAIQQQGAEVVAGLESYMAREASDAWPKPES